jgi:hypothetical protein
VTRFHDWLRQRLSRLPFALDSDDLLARDAPHGLAAPGLRSANGHCGLFAARDGWVAVNLARPEDRDVVPALTGTDSEPWAALAQAAATRPSQAFVADAAELQLPAAVLGEAEPCELAPGGGVLPRLKVLDLSALWAGPLCAGLLARMGARVRRVENTARPDPTPLGSPRLDRRLNGEKTRLAIDLTTREGKARLGEEIARADVIVTSARAAACASLGLNDALLARRRGLIWAAITGHGWAADRVGFGDDCAVAGGLVRRKDGEPRFLGDAVADPLTGLEAALAVREAACEGRGGRLDLAMARIACAYAAGSA